MFSHAEEVNDTQAPVVSPKHPSVSVGNINSIVMPDNILCVYTINFVTLASDVFRKEDIPFLMKELRDVAPKWLIFCPQLGIPTSELDIITANPLLLSGAPLTFFQRALDYWISHMQSNATVSTLCEALRTSLVEESSLALRFEARFWEHRG